MQVIHCPRAMTCTLLFLYLILCAAVKPASAAVTEPVSLSEVRRFLEETRTHNNSTSRLESIRKFDNLILTGEAATRAIEQCNEAEFKLLRSRIVDVIDSTTAARRRLAELERRRRNDVKALDDLKNQKDHEAIVLIKYFVKMYSIKNQIEGMEEIMDAALDNAAKGTPEPIGVVLRGFIGAVKEAERKESRRFKKSEKLEKLQADINKLDTWKKEINSPEVVAAIRKLHELARARIRAAKRVLKYMDKLFSRHACVKCVDDTKKVVANPVMDKESGVWITRTVYPQQCVVFESGKVITTYPDGRKVTVSVDKQTGEVEILNLLPTKK